MTRPKLSETRKAVAAERHYVRVARLGYSSALADGGEGLLAAVDAVLALEAERINGRMMGYEIHEAEGFNRALREVRTAITDHLDVEG